MLNAIVFRSCVLLALLLGACGLAAPAQATPSFDNCTGFLELDANGTAGISAPGVWCLDHDLTGAMAPLPGVRIQIVADDVVLDCKGFRVRGDPARPRLDYGIRALDHGRLAIRNCVLDGFQTGIQVLWIDQYARDLLVEDNVLVDNNFAIETQLEGTVMRRNRVRGAISGIAVGEGAQAYDNRIDGVTDFGIAVVWPHGAEVRGNTIRLPADATADTTGIRLFLDGAPTGYDRAFVSDNVVVGAANGIGIDCGGPDGRYADNVLNGVATGVVGCSDAGDNDVSP